MLCPPRRTAGVPGHRRPVFGIFRYIGWAFSRLLVLVWASPGGAQTISFGKNKIQYTDFQWRVLKSPHFDLYFYPEEESLATMALDMAEDSFAEIAARY